MYFRDALLTQIGQNKRIITQNENEINGCLGVIIIPPLRSYDIQYT